MTRITTSQTLPEMQTASFLRAVCRNYFVFPSLNLASPSHSLGLPFRQVLLFLRPIPPEEHERNHDNEWCLLPSLPLHSWESSLCVSVGVCSKECSAFGAELRVRLATCFFRSGRRGRQLIHQSVESFVPRHNTGAVCGLSFPLPRLIDSFCIVASCVLVSALIASARHLSSQHLRLLLPVLASSQPPGPLFLHKHRFLPLPSQSHSVLLPTSGPRRLHACEHSGEGPVPRRVPRDRQPPVSMAPFQEREVRATIGLRGNNAGAEVLTEPVSCRM